MREDLISFTVAKLAKEKGFNILCFNYYFEDGELREHTYTGTNGHYGDEFSFGFDDLLKNWNDKFLTKKNGDRCFGCDKSRGYFETYSAPTLTLLQKWIRENHDIHIKIEHFNDDSWGGDLIYDNAPYDCDDFDTPYDAEDCKTYEDALEICLKEALKLIN